MNWRIRKQNLISEARSEYLFFSIALERPSHISCNDLSWIFSPSEHHWQKEAWSWLLASLNLQNKSNPIEQKLSHIKRIVAVDKIVMTLAQIYDVASIFRVFSRSAEAWFDVVFLRSIHSATLEFALSERLRKINPSWSVSVQNISFQSRSGYKIKLGVIFWSVHKISAQLFFLRSQSFSLRWTKGFLALKTRLLGFSPSRNYKFRQCYQINVKHLLFFASLSFSKSLEYPSACSI